MPYQDIEARLGPVYVFGRVQSISRILVGPGWNGRAMEGVAKSCWCDLNRRWYR